MLYVCLLILLVPLRCVETMTSEASRDNIYKIKMANFNGGQRFWTFQMLVTPRSLIMFAWNFTQAFLVQ
jgi:hypothetical protein